MELDIGRQAVMLAASFCVGVGLGLIYDLLRPPRRYGAGFTAVLLDALFCAAAGAAVFLLSMSAGGRLGQWELAFALAGFMAYMWLLSPLLGEAISIIYSAILRTDTKIKNILIKFIKRIKICFKKLWDCFIIRKNRHPNA